MFSTGDRLRNLIDENLEVDGQALDLSQKAYRRKQMSKFALSLVAGLAAFALGGSPSGAEPVPDHATGIWSTTDCGDGSFTFMVNSSTALITEGKRVALIEAKWVAGSLVLGDDLVLPPLDSLKRCDVLPGSLPVLFAATIATFKRLDEIDAACEDAITPQCVAVAFDIIDVTGDGKFSQAELSRGIRAAVGFYIIDASSKKDMIKDIHIAQLVSSALAPFVAGNLIESYDFDGDGFLTLGELMQDRIPDKGLEGVVANLASEASPEVLSTIMKSMTGLSGLLP